MPSIAVGTSFHFTKRRRRSSSCWDVHCVRGFYLSPAWTTRFVKTRAALRCHHSHLSANHPHARSRPPGFRSGLDPSMAAVADCDLEKRFRKFRVPPWRLKVWCCLLCKSGAGRTIRKSHHFLFPHNHNLAPSSRPPLDCFSGQTSSKLLPQAEGRGPRPEYPPWQD
jgi:hypothetical protein